MFVGQIAFNLNTTLNEITSVCALTRLLHLQERADVAHLVKASGLRVEGSGFRVQGLGFGVQGSGYEI